MGFAYERGLERSVLGRGTACTRLQSRKKLDSLIQGLKRASSKERNGRSQDTSEESRALGLLRRGKEGEALVRAFRQAHSVWVPRLPPFCVSSVKLLKYCEPQGPCLEKGENTS